MFNSTENQKEDIVPIAKIGENSICLAYYFYDLCDEYGIVVWNMFDFEGDARSEGEENEQNHKGLVNNGSRILEVCVLFTQSMGIR